MQLWHPVKTFVQWEKEVGGTEGNTQIVAQKNTNKKVIKLSSKIKNQILTTTTPS